jgi:ABC-2 type transport system ATP-binding protein
MPAVADAADAIRVPMAPSSLAPRPSPLAPLLLFEQVSKWYGPVLALNQVTLELTAGITGLVGANGAGKSTLIRLATGQSRPTLGRVTVAGVDAWDWRARLLVGYCPDHDAFYEDLSGRRFVREMARLCGYPRADAVRRADAALDRVGMSDRADRPIRGYSKGMRQRVKLAQALLPDPRLLVLDEPLGGIDPVGRAELLALFRSLAAEGRCLLVSSHELEELEKLTDHVAVMARGRIAAVGTVRQIRDLLDDFPLTVRVDVDDPRGLARRLLDVPEVVGCDVAADGSLTVRAHHPQRFLAAFGRAVIDAGAEVRRLEPLDDSAHAVLGYLLGGSGKT